MEDPECAGAVLAELHALGVRLSLDARRSRWRRPKAGDRGTGHSSLAHLRRLPVEELKIDRSFVLSMGSDPLDAAIVRSTIDLARNLGLTVVAEGVEDEPTLRALTDLGCHLAQGYHLSRPVPAEELEVWLRGQRAELVAA